MNVETSLGRIRTQLSGMERMVRILRAEIESQISEVAPGDLDRLSEIPSGLGALFREAQPMTAQAVDPYKHFAKGVWIGMDQEVGATGATVGLKALGTGQGHGRGNGRGVARLSVNPVFPLVEKPRWVTLETTLDVAALKSAQGLRVDTVSFFEIGAGNAAQMPRSVTLTLRLHRKGGKATDHLDYRVPVSTMPFEHSARFGAAAMAELALEDVTEALMILELPLAGIYALKLDHFAVMAVEGG